MLLGGNYLDYYTFTQFSFDNSIKSSIIYRVYLPEQKKNIANNKKPYKGSRFASGAGFLSSSGSIKVKNYQFITGHEARFFIDNIKMDYNKSCLSTNSENN